jgi:hypothetical protein
MVELNLKEKKLEIKDSLVKALKRNKTIILTASCTVDYSGRAEAFLDKGDRIIIIKSDNTLLIHQPNGNAPVNYMKPNSKIKIIDADNLIIESSNESLNEYLTITIFDLISMNLVKLDDCEKIQLYGTEKHMSDYIYNHPEIISTDFIPVSREEQTKYGFIDVFGYDKKKNLVVIECKRYKAGPDAAQQLRRYIERLAKSKGIPAKRIKGIVAAPDITKNAKLMVKELGYKFKKVEAPAYMRRKTKQQQKLRMFI